MGMQPEQPESFSSFGNGVEACIQDGRTADGYRTDIPGTALVAGQPASSPNIAAAMDRRNGCHRTEKQKMNAALQTLCSSFHEKGLNPILLKGQGIARLYENPLLRECGDIDLYFQSAHDRDAALQHIRKMCIQIKEEPDGSAFYVWQGVKVEHHQRLFDLYNPFQQNSINLLIRQKGFQETGSAPYRLPSPFLNLLLLNLHILKHALGRGIGLRQFCDMARACYKLHGNINREEMKTVCRKLGLGQWNPLLHAFLTDCLGLPAECLPYDETASTAQPLSDIVWRGGTSDSITRYTATRKERHANGKQPARSDAT